MEPSDDADLLFLEKKAIKGEELTEAYQRVAASKEGQMMIEHLLFIAGVTRLRTVRDSDDRIHQEGQRQLCFGIMEKIALDHVAHQQMIMERIRARKGLT